MSDESKQAVSASLRCLERVSIIMEMLDQFLIAENGDPASQEVSDACAELATLMDKLEQLKKYIDPDDAAYLLDEVARIRGQNMLN